MTKTAAALAALSQEAWATGGAVMHLMGGAEENAAETVHVEKSMDNETAATWASLESLLAYSDDRDAVAWFVARGVTF